MAIYTVSLEPNPSEQRDVSLTNIRNLVGVLLPNANITDADDEQGIAPTRVRVLSFPTMLRQRLQTLKISFIYSSIIELSEHRLKPRHPLIVHRPGRSSNPIAAQ